MELEISCLMVIFLVDPNRSLLHPPSAAYLYCHMSSRRSVSRLIGFLTEDDRDITVVITNVSPYRIVTGIVYRRTPSNDRSYMS